MKQGLLILLAGCVLALAMVPRDKRDAAEQKLLCATETPCSWSFYNPVTKIVTDTLINEYCECGNGTTCQFAEDDSSGKMYVFRCALPQEEDSS